MGDLSNELRAEVARRFPDAPDELYVELLDRIEEIEDELGTEETSYLLLGVAASLHAVNRERQED